MYFSERRFQIADTTLEPKVKATYTLILFLQYKFITAMTLEPKVKVTKILYISYDSLCDPLTIF